MQLIEGTLGGLTFLAPQHHSPRKTVTLPHLTARVHVFLRGFDIGYDDGDYDLNRLEVTLEVVSGPNSLEVDVIAHISLQNRSWFGAGSPLVRAVVYYTILVD